MNYNTEVFPDPIKLPDNVFHGGATAYGTGCRCRHCTTWSRMYSQIRYYKQHNDRLKKRREAKDYLALRGVYTAGQGPFGRAPHKLAQLVADYLGDDVNQWIEGKGRGHR